MKVLFSMPRYHTNQIPIFKGFITRGDELLCLVQYKGTTEDYSVLEPIMLKEGIISKAYKLYLSVRYKKQPSLVENKTGIFFTPRILSTYQLIKSFSPDLVIVRERSITNLCICTLSKLLGIKKIIVYNQSPLFRTNHTAEYRNKLKKILFSRVTYTPVQYEEYPVIDKTTNTFYTEPCTYFVPFVADTINSGIKEYCVNGIIRILDVGKFREYKNHFVLVDAASILCDKGYDNFTISIVGQVENDDEKKYYEKLDKTIKSKNLGKYISLIKNVPYCEMKQWYLEHDIFVLTSRKELASVSVIESMGYGLATISTNANGTASYIENGKNGAIFETKDAHSLACVLEKYLQNPSLVEKHGLEAKKSVCESCCFDAYYLALQQIITKEFSV
jgi:glycosyltransferase involved in cell wall biosynthesis